MTNGPSSVVGAFRRELQQVANYISNYYNLVRLHSYLDYVSPIEFETNASR
ncbi:MAG: IS3 family transposase [Deltaproteobacteria bacterium]